VSRAESKTSHNETSAQAGDTIQEKISRAMSAGPDNVSTSAQIIDTDPQGKMTVLRGGSNGFTCMPGNPKVVGEPPMCVDAASMQALVEGRTRAVDLLKLTHATGEIYSFNLLSVGFTADVAALTNRMFKPFGDLGYLLGVFVRLVQLRRRSLALRCDDDLEWNEARSLFLTFNNSKYTGGNMLIAPDADATDGLIEFVRWGPIGRLGLLRTLPRLYDGTHIKHPLASRRAVRHVEFKEAAPVDVMIDGEVAKLECRSLDVIRAAMDVFI